MTTIRGSIVKMTEFLRILVVVYSHRFYTDILWWAYEIDDCNRFKGLNDKFYLFCWQWLLCIISLVHYVNASGRVCVGNEFKLEFGHQFDVTSTNIMLFYPADAVASVGLKDAPTSIWCKVTDANTSLEFKIEPKMINCDLCSFNILWRTRTLFPRKRNLKTPTTTLTEHKQKNSYLRMANPAAA